jgi:hypothetical protein
MGRLLPYWLLVALVVHAGAHVALLVRLARKGPRYRALVAFFLPPLAPYYGWLAGAGRLALVWLVALGAYALGVALANL